MKRANYSISKETPTEIVLEDIGPWDRCPTVTNDAENVVDDLRRQGKLTPGRRVLYRDSDGMLDELLVKDGRFAGFGAVG